MSDDNPYSESLLRTLKYTPAYPRKLFASIEAARRWVYEFVAWYNNQHRHSDKIRDEPSYSSYFVIL